MDEYTASLLIKVYPSGRIGKVYYDVTDEGPEHLTEDEVINVLRSVLALAEQRKQNPPLRTTTPAPVDAADSDTDC